MKLRLLIFAVSVIGVAVGLHAYLWRRLVRDTALPPPWRLAALGLLVFLVLALVAAIVLRRVLAPELMRWIAQPVYLWLGLLLLLLTALVAGDALSVLAWLTRRLSGQGGPVDPQRRVALSRLLGGAAVAWAGGAGIFGARAARDGARLVTRRVEVPLAGLPAALDGFRIVLLTDLHIGWSLRRAWLEEVVARVNALAPDLIAITGDLVDGSVQELRDEVAPLATLRAAHGSFFCTGNHEYYSGAVAWCAAIEALGVRVLRNERVAIGAGAEGFDLAGIDDYSSAGMAPGHGPDLPRALDGRDPQRALVLLAHQPRAIFEAARLGVGLQLSGHTHGGQIWPMTYLVRLQQPYVQGLVRHEGSWLYISQGTGYWGPPMRLGTIAEITELTLRAGITD
ncbi:MAG: metallophosphoesterase [Proteobacteria bacterium]|nr:metallophosphoesterase [Pseudomonadota bacterium]